MQESNNFTVKSHMIRDSGSEDGHPLQLWRFYTYQFVHAGAGFGDKVSGFREFYNSKSHIRSSDQQHVLSNLCRNTT